MKDFDNLSSYLPSCVLNHVITHEMLVPPQIQTYKTVCLFADVSGFTVLSENLCNMGNEGTEELAEQLNRYVGQIVKLTSRAGGDVVKFAGDAMLAVWPAEDHIQDALLRAAQCAWDMQQRLANYKFVMHATNLDGKETDEKRYEGTLAVKFGIGVGQVTILHVGGESDNIFDEKYEYVATGRALEEAFTAEKYAKAGDVIVSKAAFDMLKKSGFAFEPCAESKGTEKSYKIKAYSETQTVRWKNTIKQNVENPSSEGEARIWKYVPAAVLPYLHESNEFWAPELRRVTTLFVNLGFAEADLVEINPGEVQIVFTAVQQSVFQFEGAINKFLVDDKGSTLIAVFGLPPFAHENDSTRAVLSAMSILNALEQEGKKGSIGITTGVAFCGVVGTRGNRREYSVIGDPINTAARLMVEAKKRQCGHLMDLATSQDVRDDLSTEKVGMALLKGKANEIPLYQVSGGDGAAQFQVARVTGYVKRTVRRATALAIGPASPSTESSSDKKLKKNKTAGGGGLKKISEAISSNKNLSPLSEETTEIFKKQKLQVAAITEAPKLRAIRDEALRSRPGYISTTSPNGGGGDMRAVALVKGMEAFAQQTQRGLTQGTGRSRGESSMSSLDEKPPAALVIVKNLKVKAAQIRFDNCAATGSSEGLSTTFTLPLVEGMEVFADLKEAALTRLGGRMLLKRGPNADRALFYFTWGDDMHPGKSLSDDTSLDSLQGETNPIIKIVLNELKDRPQSTRPMETPRASARRKDAIRSQLEDARNSLLKGESGRVVVFEGAHGVGKSRLAASVLFSNSTNVQSVLTGVAMGNPYELQKLAKPFSVWTVLLRQLLEEALTLRGKTPIPIGQETREQQKARVALSRDILKNAMTAAMPSFSRFHELDDVMGDLILENSEFDDEPGESSVTEGGIVRSDTAHSVSSAAQKFTTAKAVLLTNLIVGLSMNEAGVMVLIDDSHFMDVGSWTVTVKLAQEISTRGSKVLVFLLHRALADNLFFSASSGVGVCTPATELV